MAPREPVVGSFCQGTTRGQGCSSACASEFLTYDSKQWLRVPKPTLLLGARALWALWALWVLWALWALWTIWTIWTIWAIWAIWTPELATRTIETFVLLSIERSSHAVDTAPFVTGISACRAFSRLVAQWSSTNNGFARVLVILCDCPPRDARCHSEILPGFGWIKCPLHSWCG